MLAGSDVQTFHDERCRRAEAAQFSPPEYFRESCILRALPFDELPEWPRAWRLRGRWLVVKPEGLIEQNGERSAIQNRVVKSPHQPPVPVAAPEEPEAQQRGGVHFKATGSILAQPFGKARVIHFPSRFDGEGHLHFLLHELLRRLAIPAKCGPQNPVPSDDALPCGAEPIRIHRLGKRDDELLNVHTTARLCDGMKKHALLQWRQRVSVG